MVQISHLMVVLFIYLLFKVCLASVSFLDIENKMPNGSRPSVYLMSVSGGKMEVVLGCNFQDDYCSTFAEYKYLDWSYCGGPKTEYTFFSEDSCLGEKYGPYRGSQTFGEWMVKSIHVICNAK